MYEIDETENEKKLRQVLTPEEYQTVMENKEYKVQFRILKFLNRDWENMLYKWMWKS